uniref:Cell division cycle associated 8 n=1 Tax=Neogobius melanostomus TaxID=47308 RepID=A0A8C6WJI7_9GOBI
MAPRKRTTKQPKNNPKTAKLEAFLEDFDSEVKARVGQLKEKLSQLLKDVDNGHNMALIKLPKAIRQMNWIEHFKAEKPKSPEVDHSKRQEQTAIVESVVAEDHAVLMQSVKKPSKKKGSSKSSSEDETPGTVKKTRATRKPPTTSKRTKALSVNKQNSTIRRSNRKPLVTPARTMMDSSLMMGSTPLITPRFDPR